MEKTTAKLTIGRTRKAEIKTEDSAPHSDLLTVIGLCTMCLMLILAMRPTDGTSTVDYDEAVAVMSTAVGNSAETEREELVLPDKKASSVGEDSVFETIGEFFASLITGES